VLGLWQKIEEGSLVKLGLAVLSELEQSFASGVEGALEKGEESEGGGSKDLSLGL